MDDKVRYYDKFDEMIPTLLPMLSRSGYNLRCIALDKAGKKPVAMANGDIIYNQNAGTDYKWLGGFASKNKGSATLYAVWDKVSPAKPTSTTATFAGGKLAVRTNESADADTAYEIQYSTNMLFWGGNTTITTDYNETSYTSDELYGSKYYVRVRRIMKDSTGAGVKGTWGPTIRASKNVN